MDKRAIICYHGVDEKNTLDNKTYYVSPLRCQPVDKFVEQIKWMDSVGSFLSLEDLLSFSNKKDNWLFSITFDDGYRNNVEKAFPHLLERKIPFTWFLVSQYIEDNTCLPWWDMLDYLLGIGIKKRQLERDKNCILLEKLGVSNKNGKIRQKLIDFFLNASPSQEKELSEILKDNLKFAGRKNNAFISNSDLKKIASNPLIEIGGHSVTHANLVKCDAKELKDEIWFNKSHLQSSINRTIKWFSYPYGAVNFFNRNVKDALSNSGYTGAVTTIPGLLFKTNDLFALPRISVLPSWDLKEFKLRIKFATYWRIYRLLKQKIQNHYLGRFRECRF